MKIFNVLPIASKSLWTKGINDYVVKYLGKETQMDTIQIESGALSIEGEYDEALNTPDVIRLCIQWEKDGYDGILSTASATPGSWPPGNVWTSRSSAASSLRP